MDKKRNVELISGLLKERQETISKTTLDHIYNCYKESGRIDAALWKTGDKADLHFYYDSDVAKFIEAAAGSLTNYPDQDLHTRVQEVINNLISIQTPDGYLNSYITNKAPEERWQNIRHRHELYCAGHLIEAAIAWHKYCGDERFLKAIEKYADLICNKFGDKPEKSYAFPGHPEIELALYRLFKYTGKKHYLETLAFFIYKRGTNNAYYYDEGTELGVDHNAIKDNLENLILDKPLTEQTNASGHAVRACYLYCGMVDLAHETGDEELFTQCKTIWKSIVEQRMNITGGIGSSWQTEGFIDPYNLPEGYYYETCAQIALFLFSWRMLKHEKCGEYTDIMEKTLYNSILSGISTNGKAFFYSNPLIAVGNQSDMNKHGSDQWGTGRLENFLCSCCPPNISRLLAFIDTYMFEQMNGEIWLHLFGGYNVEYKGFKIQMATDYPWDNRIKISIDGNEPEKFKLFIRQPSWCKNIKVCIDGKTVEIKAIKGYFCLEQIWESNIIEIKMKMDVETIAAHPRVRQAIGKTAVTRGPIVYCAEEIDNQYDVFSYKLLLDDAFTLKHETINEIDTVTLKTAAKTFDPKIDYQLYQNYEKINYINAELKLIPYFLWNNRKTGRMLLWFDCDNNNLNP